jgi:hypothetical protein
VLILAHRCPLFGSMDHPFFKSVVVCPPFFLLVLS